ncbi:hypothetical protein EVAR_46961_1 [Eumeta japonica]|uniref:Uncharacterized protein n=1 Tax=Eumeta variegata TaxID=151549 RepID=A0A4C1YLZ1_EUMVA|nr:hypothetical protein EVAR_46961_1 [Eumeta japonica]
MEIWVRKRARGKVIAIERGKRRRENKNEEGNRAGGRKRYEKRIAGAFRNVRVRRWGDTNVNINRRGPNIRGRCVRERALCT